MGIAINDDNNLLSWDGTFWKQFSNLNQLLMKRYSAYNTNIATANYGIGKALNGKWYSECLPIGHYNAIGQHVWNGHKDTCSELMPGTKSLFFSESSYANSDGIPACPSSYTWLGEPNGFDYYYWKAFNTSNQLISSHWSASYGGQKYHIRCLIGSPSTPPSAY